MTLEDFSESPERILMPVYGPVQVRSWVSHFSLRLKKTSWAVATGQRGRLPTTCAPSFRCRDLQNREEKQWSVMCGSTTTFG